MTATIDRNAYGIAALAAIESLILVLSKKGGISPHEISSLLEQAGKMLTSRGVTTNNDVDAGAARLVSGLVAEIAQQYQASS